MARSIHTTLRHFIDHLADRYADLETKRARGRELREALARKRSIKAQIQAERRTAAHPPAGGPPSPIEIVTVDDGSHVHHGVTPDEVRAVIERMPPGFADGLGTIFLGLGSERQPEDDDHPPDPFTGRRSVERWPGVYSGRVLGTYFPDRAEVLLCAFVYDAATLRERRIKELLLKLGALATLVHELGHHYDHTARIARGRWLADEEAKLEIYAEHAQHTWTQSVVIPYLEEVHSAEVAYLRAWIHEHGGLDVPLAVLVEDPRTTQRDGHRTLRFRIDEALSFLLQDVEAERDPIATRIEFARQLHYRDEYEWPRAILTGVLAEQPTNIEALTLAADIDVHEGDLATAEARCRDVLARAPEYVEAWLVLADALEDGKRWEPARETTTAALASSAPDSHALFRLVRYRARAHLELGDDAALEHDLRGLALGSRLARGWTVMLRAIQLLRQDRLVEALDLASHAITAKIAPARVELLAVRYDAAHRLGRPEAAGTLSERDLERLGNLGHDTWVARLRALPLASVKTR
jgi:hypothetical protein